MHQIPILPRSSETNSGGHIGATALSVWFEEGCQDLIMHLLPGFDFNYFMARTEQNFLREIFHGTEVSVRNYVHKIGNSSVSIGHQVWQNNQLCSEAISVIVYVSRESNKPAPLPDFVRETLEKHMDPKQLCV